MNNENLAPLEWYTIQKKVNELVPCDFNPRQISDLELKKTQREFRKI